MKHRILLAAAVAALAGAPALGQANDVATNNAAQTVNNAAGDAMPANVSAPAAPGPTAHPADPAAPAAAPEATRAAEPASFPWGVLGLLGLAGLIGSRRRSS